MNDEIVFRHFTRAALDREYDNRAKVADSAEHIAWYGERSRGVRAASGGALGVRYGPHPAETLDIFGVADGAPRPVNVFFHGGYWRSLSKDDFSYVAGAFVPAGALSVVVDYALIPSVDMDELVSQCRRAMVWLYHNVARYGGDPERLFASGHSAGGHLVAMLMATDWTALDSACPAGLVRGGLGISGLYDLEPVRLTFLNEDLGLDPEAARRNSPACLHRAGDGPMVAVYGGREGEEYTRQSQILERAWPLTRAVALAGYDHFSIMREFDRGDGALADLALDMMGLR